MIVGYICSSRSSTPELYQEIQAYAQRKGLKLDHILEDTDINKTPWQDRVLYQLIHDQTQAGDTLIVYEASHLARSTAQVLDILQDIIDRGLVLHLVKYEQIYPSSDHVDTETFIELIQNIESDFVAKRVTAALARRKAAGLPVGRPKGRKNKALKLDKHRKEIQKYLDLQVSRASIAKLIGCNAQTLYNYIQKRNLKAGGVKDLS